MNNPLAKFYSWQVNIGALDGWTSYHLAAGLFIAKVAQWLGASDFWAVMWVVIIGIAWEIFEYIVEGTAETYGTVERWAWNTATDLFVSSPLYPRDNQLTTMKVICSKLKLDENVANTVLVMTTKRRLFALKDMILQFKDLCRQERNELIIEVASASELSKSNLDEIKKSISAKIDGNIIIKSRCDPSIIGGLILKVGSKLIDTSIRSKLSKLKNNLKEVG